MAENTALTFKYLTPDLFEFLDATIMAQTSPEEVRGICTYLGRAASRAAELSVSARSFSNVALGESSRVSITRIIKQYTGA